jgi:hypothetical protein
MTISGVRKALVFGVATLAASASTLSGPGGAVAASRWAPADKADITPGVQMLTQNGQCTGNFVFTDARERVYVGYAAHCASSDEAPVSGTNGCRTPTHPIGTAVRFERGGSALISGELVGKGRLAYSSWVTMQQLDTKDAKICEFNDFALVRVAKAHVGKVNPSVPVWGGPMGLRSGRPSVGDQVFTYGNSTLRGGLTATSPKDGYVTGSEPNGWRHYLYTVTPGIPGDSGSGYLDGDGLAFGTLSIVAVTPYPAENGVGDLARELAFAKEHSGIRGLRLVKGTEPFVGLD